MITRILIIVMIIAGTASCAESARLYRLQNDRVVTVLANDYTTEGLNHVTILGALENPGVYFFEGDLPLECVVDSAKPVSPGLGDGSAMLSRLTILSATGQRRPLTLDYTKYRRAVDKAGHKAWMLSGNEVIWIPEIF